MIKFDPNTLEFKGVFIDDSAGGVGQLNHEGAVVNDAYANSASRRVIGGGVVGW